MGVCSKWRAGSYWPWRGDVEGAVRRRPHLLQDHVSDDQALDDHVAAMSIIDGRIGRIRDDHTSSGDSVADDQIVDARMLVMAHSLWSSA